MEAFTQLGSIVVPIDRVNVDTDAIIPKQFLKSVNRTGFGPNLFDAWRYTDIGEEGVDASTRPKNMEFPLNQERYQGAQILLARTNFGCGSSREHAAWALHDQGIRALIAPSYGDIFFSNSGKNGLLLVTLSEAEVDELFEETYAEVGYALTIDLAAKTLTKPNGDTVQFDFDATIRHRMLNGLDDIGVTLDSSDQIKDYERRRALEAPWLFPNV
jgi:3-isopropylmalate/(R)-2-methylmalate dehydratase small subunit